MNTDYTSVEPTVAGHTVTRLAVIKASLEGATLSDYAARMIINDLETIKDLVMLSVVKP